MKIQPSIAILITNFEGGGAQRIALTQARAFTDRGYPVKVIALEKLDHYHIPTDLDVTFLTEHSGQASKWQKALVFPSLPFRLTRLLKDHDISLCISHLERADFVNILAKPMARHKTISVIHSHLSANYHQEGQNIRSFVYLNLVKLLERFSDVLSPVSLGIAMNLESLGLPPAKIRPIPNPFFIEEIEKLSRKRLEDYKSIFKAPIMLSIGRLSRQKGLWHGIKAFANIKKSHPKLRYVILGDGPMRDFHYQLAKKLGLSVYAAWKRNTLDKSYDVYFLGFVDNPYRFLSRASIFVLPSHYEGLPNVIIESMICQTPVIASDCDAGPRELLAPKTDLTIKTEVMEQAEFGILTPLPDPRYEVHDVHILSQEEQELAKAINKILGSPTLADRYRKRAYKQVKHYHPDRIIPQWEELITELTR